MKALAILSTYMGIFFLHVAPNESFSINSIHNGIKESFDLDIPTDFIKTITKRLRKNGHVEYKEIQNFNASTIKVSDAGEARKQEIGQKIDALNREEKALLNSLKIFLDNKHDEEQLKTHLNFFIQNNLYMTTNILDRGNLSEDGINGEIEESIRQFFIKSEDSDPENFNRLKVILLGKIISANIIAKQESDRSTFKNITIYIDTNIFLSMLGLHSEDINKAVSDTIKLIKEAGSQIKIFEHTKDEVCRVLRGFIHQSHSYSRHIKVDSIYYFMKRKGYDNQMVMSLITNIEGKFNEHGISVEYNKTNENIVVQGDVFSKLNQLKTESSLDSIECDCKSFALIRELRKPLAQLSYFIEKCKVIFLTSDKKFAQLSEDENKKYGTIPEVITHSQLTGILWLKKIDHAEDAFIRNFLEQGVKLEIISSALWERFMAKLKESQENGTLNQGDINELISRRETESILLKKSYSGIEEIFEEQNIQKIKNESKARNERVTQLENALEKQTKEYDDLVATLSRIDEKINDKCKKRAASHVNKQLTIAIIIATGLDLMCLILMYRMFSTSPSLLSFLPFLLPVLIGLEMRFKKPIVPRAIKNWISFDWIQIRNDWENKKITQFLEEEKSIPKNES